MDITNLFLFTHYESDLKVLVHQVWCVPLFVEILEYSRKPVFSSNIEKVISL